MCSETEWIKGSTFLRLSPCRASFANINISEEVKLSLGTSQGHFSPTEEISSQSDIDFSEGVCIPISRETVVPTRK